MSTDKKNILITGACGFIASHVCRHLVNNYPNYTIVNLDIIDKCASAKNVTDLEDKPNYFFCRGDICNMDLVAHLMHFHQIDHVMHFAAQSHVDASFGNPLIHTQTNVLGTHTLLECARASKTPIKKFIHVSTDEVYGDVLGDGVFENAMLEPTNPYSCSKAAAEFITKAYMRSYKLPIIVTRGNNVYGPNQYPEKVIPKFILRLLKGHTCCLHGDGAAKRSYIHVLDVVSAFDTILHKGEPFEVYNIGSKFEISMKDLALSLVKELGLRPAGQEGELVEHVEDRNINDQRYAVDDQKLKALGWETKVEWEAGIKGVIDWYKAVDPAHWRDTESALAPHPTNH
eukprot:CAMPEP_0206249952 /NCGR_PEP_ID=MMETSP0047_2-20121206/21201_1 /ASSEMBLY_ACC=CAM_ASM_000192 /TAXON_ID=195065 /ORGANISM="Chroomonas mesostigmatica_cf, Strain CCMP1168" /LENGTH=342 /DNA_ID=CAMNT_0053675745 /DNA_START=40 /DNA_END=1068 /DNA_ORIENTATION=-